MAKFAIQTIAWGDASLDEIMKDVTEVGYQGIELFQHPEELGGIKRLIEACWDYAPLVKELDKEPIRVPIKILGICAGSFDERCALVREYCTLTNTRLNDAQNAPYVYCDEWKLDDPRFGKAVQDGFRVALHPHMYKPVQTMREVDIILKSSLALFLPDTAHLKIAGDNPVEAIRRYSTRLAAVHVKDWREEVGRSFHFYARGFCELGEGNIELGDVLDQLAEQSYQGWYVVEQDTTPTDRRSSVQKSLDWLVQEVNAPHRRHKSIRIKGL